MKMQPFLKDPIRRLKRLVRQSSKWPIGYAIIAGVLVIRWLGLFSHLELLTLDFLLRNRLSESLDEEVVIVLFNVNTVQSQSGLDEPTEEQLAQLLKIIFSADPAAVGLNIFLDDTSNDPGRAQLIDMFETHPNLIGVQKGLPPREINPPADMPKAIVEKQFGLNDVPIDQDGRIRRTFLGSYLPPDDSNPHNSPFNFSFSFKLAAAYLASQNYTLENHPRNPDIPIFQRKNEEEFVAISILNPHSGGYSREANISKIQGLLNFRAGSDTFQIIEAFKLFNRSISPEFLQDKVVIVGKTDSYFPRFLPVGASSNLIRAEYSQNSILPRIGIIGSELEAHSTSQIIDAVIDGRSLIKPLSSVLEDCLIVILGLSGILISTSLTSTIKSIFALAGVALIIFVSAYVAIVYFGIWIPIMPIAFCFLLSGIIYLNYKGQQTAIRSQQEILRSQQNALIEAHVIESERRKAIERAFSAIHAGPLQRLATLLRTSKDGNLNQEDVINELELLNKEIRGVGDRLRQEAIGDVYFFYSEGDIKLDLTHPMHEVLYEVYNLAVQRKLPGFGSVKVRAVTIEPFNCKQLNLDIKRQLCWFLEESLQNIGKHAIGTTRIQVSGKHIDEFYRLRIEDNGPGIQSSHTGDGTQFSYRLESLLRGKFSRFSKPEGGTICELNWPSSIKHPSTKDDFYL